MKLAQNVLVLCHSSFIPKYSRNVLQQFDVVAKHYKSRWRYWGLHTRNRSTGIRSNTIGLEFTSLGNDATIQESSVGSLFSCQDQTLYSRPGQMKLMRKSLQSSIGRADNQKVFSPRALFLVVVRKPFFKQRRQVALKRLSSLQKERASKVRLILPWDSFCKLLLVLLVKHCRGSSECFQEETHIPNRRFIGPFMQLPGPVVLRGCRARNLYG